VSGYTFGGASKTFGVPGYTVECWGSGRDFWCAWIHFGGSEQDFWCAWIYFWGAGKTFGAPGYTSVPEIIDPVLAKTRPKRSFSMTENERFGLVFANTGSINSGTGSWQTFGAPGYTFGGWQTFGEPGYTFGGWQTFGAAGYTFGSWQSFGAPGYTFGERAGETFGEPGYPLGGSQYFW
jgi:hypothetical protein